MSAGEYCNRDVVVIDRTESVRKAIDLMRTHHVGDVIVVDKTNGASKPLGILTDRDIVLEILAEDVDLEAVNVGDVMSYELQTVDEDTKLLDAIKVMRTKGIRRLPVVDSQENLVGILAVDDVLGLIAEQLSDLVGLITRQQA
ncbi:MAG: CBS domain-containing protein, partial [Gammaproteobacteria bacterium]|nr:CBS domain-containing protein [Gammaproteobacteria bacterium]NIP90150.1 CBS domain-containing protein [Gammaproteobacteria bacterium]NIR24942.1 CBS domain-containing protein [Gammaproteobacteria bacterium]NIS06610.1 CBS domain-containing protein [Gammaproteobacteria bacterium]NIU40428.1 CBS domain-containing protein [Gammaproteobacteria bacterium]